MCLITPVAHRPNLANTPPKRTRAHYQCLFQHFAPPKGPARSAVLMNQVMKEFVTKVYMTRNLTAQNVIIAHLMMMPSLATEVQKALFISSIKP